MITQFMPRMDLQKKSFALSAGVFFGGFILGMILFFPLDKIKDSLIATASRLSGMNVQMTSLKVGTGLGLGFSKGSLIALRVEELSLTTRGKTISCHRGMIAPHLWPLLIGRLQLGVWCDLDAADAPKRELGEISLLLSAKPFWSPKNASVSFDFGGFNITNALDFASIYMQNAKLEATGRISGDLNLRDLDLAGRGSSTTTDFNLGTENLVLSNLEAGGGPVFSVPLALGKAEIVGASESGKFTLNSLKFKSDELQGEMDMEITLQASGMPQSGLWKGKIKTLSASPNTELVHLLDNTFGPIDPSGFREFVKRFDNGNFLAFMSKPTE